MPTYEYRCQNGHEFEEFQRMSDEPVAECPRCGAEAERLLSSGAGLLFKGSGFYITDYRSDDYKKKQSGESSSGKTDSTKADSPKTSSGSGPSGDGGSSGSADKS